MKLYCDTPNNICCQCKEMHNQNDGREIDQFTYLISHVLRAPVARILGLGSILRVDKQNAEFIVQCIAEETINLDQILKDINKILSVRNPKNEKWEYVQFEEQVRLVRQALNDEIIVNNALITTDFKRIEGTKTIKNHLYNIFFHLLSNSLKFRSPDLLPLIHLEANLKNNHICLSIIDNGRGIDLNQHGEKVFGLYQRFHENKIPGRGMGLCLVKTYAEAMGGTAQIKSNTKEGTQVEVFLPKQP